MEKFEIIIDRKELRNGICHTTLLNQDGFWNIVDVPVKGRFHSSTGALHSGIWEDAHNNTSRKKLPDDFANTLQDWEKDKISPANIALAKIKFQEEEKAREIRALEEKIESARKLAEMYPQYFGDKKREKTPPPPPPPIDFSKILADVQQCVDDINESGGESLSEIKIIISDKQLSVNQMQELKNIVPEKYHYIF